MLLSNFLTQHREQHNKSFYASSLAWQIENIMFFAARYSNSKPCGTLYVWMFKNDIDTWNNESMMSGIANADKQQTRKSDYPSMNVV